MPLLSRDDYITLLHFYILWLHILYTVTMVTMSLTSLQRELGILIKLSQRMIAFIHLKEVMQLISVRFCKLGQWRTWRLICSNVELEVSGEHFYFIRNLYSILQIP